MPSWSRTCISIPQILKHRASRASWSATSITSQPPSKSLLDRYHDYNPAVFLATGAARGYMRIDVTRAALRADLVAMDTVKERTSTSRVMASFAAEAGGSGLKRL